ncbi:hypothetical protein MJK72_05120 [Klebsiella pneumoniae]|nr:hypothetical protein MJK72_05120 [Klebsiella pneumoniae]
MEMLSGAEMVVQSLVDRGVKQVFGYPGGAVLDIYDAFTHPPAAVAPIMCWFRHEQAAVHMADGLARATEEVGVVLVTSGLCGRQNAITGIATAYMDSIPLVILSGQVATSLIGYDAFQKCDMVGISRPVGRSTKFPGEAKTEGINSRRAEESLLAGGQRSPRSGSGRSAGRTFSIRRRNCLTSGRCCGEHALV